jgi:SAM-dependent methyltransferase
MSHPGPDSTTRFTGRSLEYARHRPQYPDELFRYLLDNAVIWKGCTVADVGSGTGIFTKGLLSVHAVVFAVEPNQEMRECADATLGSIPGYHSVEGRSEATSLSTASVDAVTVAQAFHWFDIGPTRAEFSRILRPKGQVCIVYNEREIVDDFSREFEDLMRNHSDLDKWTRERSRDPSDFFGAEGCRKASFPNQQNLDLEGLIGRVFSASYMPKIGDEEYEGALRRVNEIFHRYQRDGRVRLPYRTKVYHGPL